MSKSSLRKRAVSGQPGPRHRVLLITGMLTAGETAKWAILGIGLGMGLCGMLPVPEIQYLAYLHNAEDQLRGEAASLRFFSGGAYTNPMVVRVAGLGYQKGFGGHFHNDNGLAALRDIPGLIVACPARPDDAAALLRTYIASAKQDGSV